jgi:hypothetical protein
MLGVFAGFVGLLARLTLYQDKEEALGAVGSS